MTNRMTNGRLTGKVVALDVGMARIGVAVCDPLRLAARPLRVIHRRSRREDFDLLARLLRDEEIVSVVVGLPLNMDDSEGPQAQSVRKWAERLATALRALDQSRPIIFWDERLSTFDAQALMGDYGRKVEEDAMAAAVILQRYLDAQRDYVNQADQTIPKEWHPFGQLDLEESD